MTLGPARFVAIGSLAVLLVLAARAVDLSGSQQSRATWRYTYVSVAGEVAGICYMEADGCRMEHV